MVRTPGWRRAGKLGQRPRIVKARSAAGSQELVAEQTHQRAERPEPQQCDQPRASPPPESATPATLALADPFAPSIRRILAVAMMGPEVGTKRRPRFRGFHRVSPQPRQARDRCNPRISAPPCPRSARKSPGRSPAGAGNRIATRARLTSRSPPPVPTALLGTSAADGAASPWAPRCSSRKRRRRRRRTGKQRRRRGTWLDWIEVLEISRETR